MSNSKDNQAPNNGSNELFEVFNKHFDDYLQKYGVATPKAVVRPEVPAVTEKVEPEAVAEEVEQVELAQEEIVDVPAEEAEEEIVGSTVVELDDHLVGEEVYTEAASVDVELEEVAELVVEPEEVAELAVEVEVEYFEPEQVEELTVEIEEVEELTVESGELPVEYFEAEQVAELVVEPEEVEYFEPEEEDFALSTDDAVSLETVGDEDLFYDPETSYIEEEEEAVAAPSAVEREIIREVIIVDRDQARDLGYGADRGVSQGNAFPAASSKPVEYERAYEPKPKPVEYERAYEPEPKPKPVEREETRAIRSEPAAEKKKGGGWFGRKKEVATSSAPRYEEKSRFREEGIDSGAGFIPGNSDSTSISLKTQDGYDARDERLRLQHVNTEKRDVDPAVWLEGTMLDALKLNASDLHIIVDGETRDLRARIRVDGQMRDFDYVQGIPARVIMGRLKAATELSSGGSFEPEETIYTINLDGEPRKARAVLFRVEDSGEALVMRLPLTGRLKELAELDFADYNLDLVTRLLAMPYKLIMIAGPMGSGKTTTAHGALLHVAKPTRTVWTIEDPVERRLPNMVQLEIDEDNGAGFDVLLSKLLRADYNTLFLGEIRDRATASAAVLQSKAGRQVMSTIHADDNIKALMRLIELAGDSPLSVLSAVGGVISQRLVRRLNPAWDGVDPETKYKGRVPVHEILFINDEIIEVMMSNRPLSEIKQAASEAIGSTFSMDANRLMEAGITDREELTMVIGEFE